MEDEYTPNQYTQKLFKDAMEYVQPGVTNDSYEGVCPNLRRAEGPGLMKRSDTLVGVITEDDGSVLHTIVEGDYADYAEEWNPLQPIDLDDGTVTLNELMGLPPFDDDPRGAGAA